MSSLGRANQIYSFYVRLGSIGLGLCDTFGIGSTLTFSLNDCQLLTFVYQNVIGNSLFLTLPTAKNPSF